jgi:hypothetical protein
MKLGDLLLHDGQHWIVRKYDLKRTHMSELLAASGQVKEIRFDADLKGEATVLSNPQTEWPFVVMQSRPSLGRLQYIARIIGPLATPTEEPLRLYVDWVASDPARMGGPVFFSPMLGLQSGNLLVAVHEKGRSRIDITAQFKTVKQRIAHVAVKPKPEKNAYTHLLDDAEFDE